MRCRASIESLQELGFLRKDLEPDEVQRQFSNAIMAATLAILVDPSPEEVERQISTMGDLIDSFSANDDPS